MSGTLIGKMVTLNNGVTVIVEDAEDGLYWGTDQDGEGYEFTSEQVHAVLN